MLAPLLELMTPEKEDCAIHNKQSDTSSFGTFGGQRLSFGARAEVHAPLLEQ